MDPTNKILIFPFKNRFKITNESDTEGFSPYLVLKQYLESLHTHLTNLPGDYPLFVRGDPAKVVKGKQEPTKWVRSPIGVDTLAKVPRYIADFLKLPKTEEYTSHSFRRSSATLAAEGGAQNGAMCVSEFISRFFLEIIFKPVLSGKIFNHLCFIHFRLTTNG